MTRGRNLVHFLSVIKEMVRPLTFLAFLAVGAGIVLPIPCGAQDVQSLSESIDLQVKTVRGFKPEKVLGQTNDQEFLLRVTRDLVGRDPTHEERVAFLDDVDPRKRARKIDALLARKEYADFWARRFERVFFGDPEKLRFTTLKEFKRGREKAILRRFTNWLADQLHRDQGWNEIVREILTSKGKSEETPALGYQLSLFRGGRFEAQVAQRVPSHFLGFRLWCAGCHDHAFDQWRVEDFYRFGAFARDVKAKAHGPGKDEILVEWVKKEIPSTPPAPTGNIWWDKRVTQLLSQPPRFIFGGTSKEGEPLLETLATLVTRKENTQFARASANRVWAWLLGRGIVHPPGDFSMAHRPISKPLLEAVTQGFIESGYSLKTLIRGITNSKAYQRKDFEDVSPGRVVRLRGAVSYLWTGAANRLNKPVEIDFDRPVEWVEDPLVVVTSGRRLRFPYRPLQRYRVPDREGLYPSAQLALSKTTPKRMKHFRDIIGKQHFFDMTVRTLDEAEPPISEMTGGFACDPRFDEIRTFRVLWGSVKVGDSWYVFRLGGVPETVDDWREDFRRILKSVRLR